MIEKMVGKLVQRLRTPQTVSRPTDVPAFEPLEERLLLSLIGVELEPPAINYDAGGTLAYNAEAQAFDAAADLTSIQFTIGARPVRIQEPDDFQLHIRVDNSGNVLGGVEGHDLVLEGWVDMNRNGVVDDGDYSGILLTGEIVEFGYLDSGTTDQYDFRFNPTGGALYEDFFIGKDIGVRMTSVNSTFADSFEVNFAGFAQGVVGVIEPLGSISGFVFADFNDDGEIDFDETVIEGVTVTLTGTNDLGKTVNVTEQTDSDGVYFFTNLRPGTYTITETQPSGYLDGKDKVGSEGGNWINDPVNGHDVITTIPLGESVDAMNYNFGERPATTGTVMLGQTATIGFWQNKNGQELIKSLNEGPTDTQLSSWLATTFPNMYGAYAGSNNLTGMTNDQVASHFRMLFMQKKVKGDTGPAKIDAQAMGVALAVYVTNSTLAGDAATHYGFLVTEYGVGVATWNIGTSGAAFGVDNNTEMSVLDILLAANDKAVNGVLYADQWSLRALANEVFSAINEAGDI